MEKKFSWDKAPAWLLCVHARACVHVCVYTLGKSKEVWDLRDRAQEVRGIKHS